MNLDHLTDESTICALASGRGGPSSEYRAAGHSLASSKFSLPIEIVGLPAMPTTGQ